MVSEKPMIAYEGGKGGWGSRKPMKERFSKIIIGVKKITF